MGWKACNGVDRLMECPHNMAVCVFSPTPYTVYVRKQAYVSLSDRVSAAVLVQVGQRHFFRPEKLFRITPSASTPYHNTDTLNHRANMCDTLYRLFFFPFCSCCKLYQNDQVASDTLIPWRKQQQDSKHANSPSLESKYTYGT